jgi:hypothetical protein
MMTIRSCSKFLVTALVITGLAQADWNPGDPYKMHFPQMPDPFGWDVDIDDLYAVGDDFLCTETGPITDIHFWTSYRFGILAPIDTLHVAIYSDNPNGPGGFSQPDQLLWARSYLPDMISTRLAGIGDQGWYTPPDDAMPFDHQEYYQVNLLIDPLDAFIQEAGMIYWLVLSVESGPHDDVESIGWKTSLDHYNDAAVWGRLVSPGAPPMQWDVLRDPITQEPLSMAFVITPEPSVLVMLLVAVPLLRRR